MKFLLLFWFSHRMIIYPNNNFEPKDSIFGLWFPWENLHFLYGENALRDLRAILKILGRDLSAS